MTSLNLVSRPWALFDAANKQHRKYYKDFVETNSWGGCPVRFTLNEESGNLISMIERNLVRFYLSKELE